MKQIGLFQSAYGIAVPVYENLDDPEAVLFDMSGLATVAGIHDTQARKRLAEHAKANGTFIIEDFGGHKVPKVPIPRPRDPVYPSLPKNSGADIPIEKWIDLVLDQHRWCDRAASLIDIIGGNLDKAAGWNMPIEILALALGQLLTATLEHLPEAEIDCVEAAALYALTSHEEWRAAGVRWLTPFRDTWFKDWQSARPGYQRFASITRKISELPKWIGGAQ